eukprot:gene267-2097_t
MPESWSLWDNTKSAAGSAHAKQVATTPRVIEKDTSGYRQGRCRIRLFG